jgi:hypothetical protein
MAILSAKYELLDEPDDVREINVPGFAGKVTKRLSTNLPDILQFGIATSDYVSTIRANQGDPTQTASVGNSASIGTFSNCWKVSTRIRSAGHGTSRVYYEIRWRQLNA